jgi:hypothetical protein
MNGVKLSPGEVSSGSANTTTGSGSDGAKLSSLDTDLTVMGSQESVYSFLRAIEQTAPLMRVGDARISKTDEGNVTLNLMLSMMYVVPGAQNAFTGKSVLFDDSEEKLFKQISEMKSYAFLNQEQQPLIPVGKQNLFEEVKVQP